MKNLKTKILSISLATTMLLSTSSCSLIKENKYDNAIISQLSGVDDNDIKNIICDYIEHVENSSLKDLIDLDSFYEKINNTTFVKLEDENTFIMGSYNEETNIFEYNNNDETIRHELGHILLPEYTYTFLNEGINQLVLNELFNYEIKDYKYEASICKVLLSILKEDEKKKFIEGDYKVILNKLSSIVPEYSDAEDFFDIVSYKCSLYRNFCEADFKGEIDSYKSTEEFTELKKMNDFAKGRLKIYLSNYYSNMKFDCSIEERLTEIFSILNIVNYDMYDPELDGNLVKDYFLKEQVDEICSTHNVDEYILSCADENAKKYKEFKYLEKSNTNVNTK